MKKLLLICFLSFNSMVFARQLQWNEGVVVLINSEIHQGEISVNAYYDLILFRKGDSVTVYPAHRIRSVYYYDAPENINRRFISIKKDSVLHQQYNLYEVVVQGDISVVRKQKNESIVTENPNKSGYNYFIKRGNDLMPIVHFRRKVYPDLLETSQGKVLSYIHENRVSPNSAAGAIQIIKFYNSQPREVFLALNR